jgi:hypothetical protein
MVRPVPSALREEIRYARRAHAEFSTAACAFRPKIDTPCCGRSCIDAADAAEDLFLFSSSSVPANG